MRSQSFALLPLATVVPMLLTGCVTAYISAEGRKEACQVAVVEKYGRPEFQPNSLSGGAGPAAGAGKGALMGLQAGGGLGSIFLAPIGAVMGAAYGTACTVASAQHPTAEADFERFLREADSGLLKRTLEERLKAPRSECTRPASASPDALVEIEKVEAGMSCLMGRQEFWLAVKWRTVTTKAGRELNKATTRLEHKSSREVDDWFAHPMEARSEIELLMTRLAHIMANEFVTEGEPAK
jgi:outer membrane lipoprotein SlyB